MNTRVHLEETAGRITARMLAGVAALAIGASSTLTLSGCNTTEGAGRDIKSLGEGIEDAADDAND
jgi:predicted small secreted protein